MEVALMGRGTLMLKLSVVEKASNLVTNTPIAVDGKIITLYLGLEGSEPLTSTPSSMYPTFHFPRLATELRPCVSDFGGHFGWVMQDTFAEAMASEGVLGVHVAIHAPSLIPEMLEIMIHEGVIAQWVVVIGQPNQCLNFGL